VGRIGGGAWSIIYVSDQYLPISLDTAFLSSLPRLGATYVLAHRAEVQVSPDIIKDGSLLIEPLAPQEHSDGSIEELLNYSSNPEVGGEWRYFLRRSLNGWIVERVLPIWEAMRVAETIERA